MMRRRWTQSPLGWLGLATGVLVLGCGSGGNAALPAPPAGTPSDDTGPPSTETQPSSEGKPSASSEVAADTEESRLVEEMTQTVARARGLPVKRPIQNQVLNREQLLVRIRDKVQREIPPDVLRLQGELLALLELIPADYDFVEGVFALLQGSIAGFYEPDNQTMYLIDDLDEDQAKETLAHELVHALQDQSWPLTPMVKFKPGDTDRISATHAVIEGDATSAMLDVTMGSAFRISPTALRRVMAVSMAMTNGESAVPPVLSNSLTAPYTDGFTFIQALRRQGDWAAVNKAWDRMPKTTEQLLHLEKYEADEPAIVVPTTPIDALGKGYKAEMVDSLGEQGLRLALEEYSSRTAAIAGAEGWGGDRLTVAYRKESDTRYDVALALHLKMDSAREMAELRPLIEQKFGTKCTERPDLGPIYVVYQPDGFLLVSGPMQRQDGVPTSIGTCELARKWAQSILTAP